MQCTSPSINNSQVLDFKLSPCSECCMLSSGRFTKFRHRLITQNKTYNSQVFKIASAFYLGFTTEGLKISFFDADVSTGKITLYHVTRCPQAAGCASAREYCVTSCTSNHAVFTHLIYSRNLLMNTKLNLYLCLIEHQTMTI
jgi:hypothetical protein